MKTHANFGERMNYGFINDMRNLVNFNARSRKSKNVHFDGLICRNYVMFELKKYRGVVP